MDNASKDLNFKHHQNRKDSHVTSKFVDCVILSFHCLGDLRNDLYLTFHYGEFEKGMSHT